MVCDFLSAIAAIAVLAVLVIAAIALTAVCRLAAVVSEARAGGEESVYVPPVYL